MRGVRRARRVLDELRERRSTTRLREVAWRCLGDEPLRVVDVGALWGLLPELDPIARFVEALGFDPDEEECSRLNAAARERGLRQRFLPYAVAGEDGERRFYVARKGASSSLLAPNLAYHRRFPDAERMDVVAETTVETRPLGAVLAAERFDAEFIKLDVHGVEDEILESLSADQWAAALGFHVELLFAELFAGQAPLGSVHDRIRRAGFELYSLKRFSSRRAAFPFGTHRTRGQISFAEGVYFRDPQALSAPQRRRLAAVAACFRHYDFAYELLDGDDEARRGVLALAQGSGRPRSASPWRSDADDWL